MASSSAALTEANVEARDFRLGFAQETLQSFKQDRSRSPRRVLLDAKDDIINSLEDIVNRQNLREIEKNTKIQLLEIQLEGLREVLAIKERIIQNLLRRE